MWLNTRKEEKLCHETIKKSISYIKYNARMFVLKIFALFIKNKTELSNVYSLYAKWALKRKKF